MINSSELRIGNWVVSKSVDNDHEPIQIVSIEADDKFEDCRPIPLTHDILVRSGFIIVFESYRKNITNDGWYISIEETDDFDVWYGKYEDWGDRLPLCSIKHLHQLQNLYFALTNSELNIQL